MIHPRATVIVGGLAIALISLLLLVPLLASGLAISHDHDWLTHLLHHRFARDSLLSGKLPLWNPYLAGGYPVAGHPEFPLGSPLLLTTLIFGEALGLKLDAALFLGAGALGCYLLARGSLGLGRTGGAAAAIALLGSSWFSWCVRDGNYVELHLLLFPLLAHLMLRGTWRNWLLAGALLSLVVIDGNVAVLSLGLMLGIVALLHPAGAAGSPLWGRLRRLGGLLGVAVVAALLAAVKVVPMAGLLARDSRRLESYAEAADSYYRLPDLVAALVQLWPASGDPYPFSRICVGGALLALALVAIPLAFRRAWVWAAVGGLAAVLSMGPAVRPDLFRLLWHLPLYGSMQHPAKAYDLFLVVALALLVGATVQLAADRLARTGARGQQWAATAALVLLTLLCLPRTLALSRVHAAVFDQPPLAAPEQTPFYQVRGANLGRYEGRPLAAEAYPNMLRGIGTIDWKQSILPDEHACPRYLVDPAGILTEEPSYRGEAHFPAGDGTVAAVRPGPGGIVVQLADARAGARLVVNQNADPGFRVAGRTVEPREGLLSSAIPTAGPQEVTFRYLPRGLWVGVATSLAAWALWTYLNLGPLRRRRGATSGRR